MQGSIDPLRLTRSTRPRLLALATLVSGVLLAGCGASSPSPTASRLGTAAASASSAATGAGATSSGSTAPGADGPQGLAFSKCMRANGVPNFPDLSGNGMRIDGTGRTISVNGVSVNVPAFPTARQKCERYVPHAQASPVQSAQQTQRGLRFARCMRGHGVPNWPDPKVITGPNGQQEAYLPGVNLQAPAVQAAGKACGGGPKGP